MRNISGSGIVSGVGGIEDVGVEEAGATRASEEDLPDGSSTASPEGRANSTGEHRERMIKGSSREN